MIRNLIVMRASLPYFKPFVVIDLDTKEVLRHCDSEAQAQAELKELQQTHEDNISKIQMTDNPMEAHKQRMQHPFGEPEKPKPLRRADKPGKRKVFLE